MNAQELINYIATSPKKTPVKLYIKEKKPIDYGDAKVFGAGDRIVFGDWAQLGPIIEQNRDSIEDIVIENDRRNSGVPLLDMKAVPARIEPGALIREQVSIDKNAVIMMGAVINIGAVIGEGTMIDMGAVLGGGHRGQQLPRRRGRGAGRGDRARLRHAGDRGGQRADRRERRGDRGRSHRQGRGGRRRGHRHRGRARQRRRGRLPREGRQAGGYRHQPEDSAGGGAEEAVIR